MSLAAPELTLAEAVPLLAAWACRVAEDAGIRCLLIKGQPATDLGVRADRPSCDVDVWVDPARHEEYLSLLRAAGWEPPQRATDGVGWGHAVTLTNPAFPSAVDVHRSFPGFLAQPFHVFESLWERRISTWTASHRVHTPDLVAAAMITLLHRARSATQPETAQDLDVALATLATCSDRERGALHRLAGETGCTEPLRDVADELLQDVGGAGSLVDLHEWQVRRHMAGMPGARWVLALRYAGRTEWPRLLLAALSPTEADRSAVAGCRGPRIRAVAFRWRRGLRAVPAATVSLMRATRKLA